MYLRITLTCILATLFSTGVSAKGVPIKPGLWEFTTTVSMPMLPQPQVNTTSECVEEDELSPEKFNQDQNNPCEITNTTTNGNTVSWSMRCPTGAGTTMDGNWKFTSLGNSISGNGAMTMEMGGQPMKVKMEWQGKRVGSCP